MPREADDPETLAFVLDLGRLHVKCSRPKSDREHDQAPSHEVVASLEGFEMGLTHGDTWHAAHEEATLMEALRRGVGFLYLQPTLRDPSLARLARLLLLDHAWRDAMAVSYEQPDPLSHGVAGDRMLQLKSHAFLERYRETESDGTALGSARHNAICDVWGEVHKWGGDAMPVMRSLREPLDEAIREASPPALEAFRHPDHADRLADAELWAVGTCRALVYTSTVIRHVSVSFHGFLRKLKPREFRKHLKMEYDAIKARTRNSGVHSSSQDPETPMESPYSGGDRLGDPRESFGFFDPDEEPTEAREWDIAEINKQQQALQELAMTPWVRVAARFPEGIECELASGAMSLAVELLARWTECDQISRDQPMHTVAAAAMSEGADAKTASRRGAEAGDILRRARASNRPDSGFGKDIQAAIECNTVCLRLVNNLSTPEREAYRSVPANPHDDTEGKGKEALLRASSEGFKIDMNTTPLSTVVVLGGRDVVVLDHVAHQREIRQKDRGGVVSINKTNAQGQQGPVSMVRLDHWKVGYTMYLISDYYHIWTYAL